eukprot:RCo022772
MTRKNKSKHRIQPAHGADLLPEQEKALSLRVKQASAARAETAARREAGSKALSANVSTALAQALHSEDFTMLDSILRTTPSSVRAASIAKLDPALALVLLRRCAQIFQLKASRAQEVLPWIKELVVTHSVFLMSQPEVSTLLLPVVHVVREHLSTFARLRQLQGRLDLLMSRLPHLQDVALSAVPLYTFEEPELSTMDLGLLHEALQTAQEKSKAEEAEEELDLIDEDLSSEASEDQADRRKPLPVEVDVLDLAIDNADVRPPAKGSDDEDDDQDEMVEDGEE